MRLGLGLILALGLVGPAQAQQRSMLDAMGITSVSLRVVRASEQFDWRRDIVIRAKRCRLSGVEGEAALRAIHSGRNVTAEVQDDSSFAGDSRANAANNPRYLVIFERRTGKAVIAAIPDMRAARDGLLPVIFNGDYFEVSARKVASVEQIARRGACRVRQG